ncbi:MAG: hypothetical protein IJZ86_01275 [Bacteroides sp.]|nr:hypothetical protein [Bacteroides sp.]
MKKLLWILLLLAVVAVFLSGYRCGQKSVQPSPPDTLRWTDTCWLAAPVVEKEIPVPVPVDVDTAAILAAHFTKRIYRDELVSTPQLTVTVVDTVYRNLLLGRTAMYDLKVPVRDRSISVGAAMTPRSFSLMAAYRRKRLELLVGYDIVNNTPFVGAKCDLWQW